jgi:hypothetical protein
MTGWTRCAAVQTARGGHDTAGLGELARADAERFGPAAAPFRGRGDRSGKKACLQGRIPRPELSRIYGFFGKCSLSHRYVFWPGV